MRRLGLGALSVIWLVPTWLVVVNATTSNETYAGEARWWPDGFALLDNVRRAWEAGDLGAGFANSLGYGLVGAFLAALVALMGSFAVVAMPVRRRAAWFWLVYCGTLFPFQIFLAPLFRMYADRGLYDTHVGLLAIYVAITVPFAFFLMRNHATTVPRELIEAGMLDGASWWQILWRIHAPLSKPALAAVVLFQFTWIWNDLLFGITLSQDHGVRPVMAALAELGSTGTQAGVPVVLAGALVVSVPTVLVFFAFQRVFVRGLRGVT